MSSILPSFCSVASPPNRVALSALLSVSLNCSVSSRVVRRRHRDRLRTVPGFERQCPARARVVVRLLRRVVRRRIRHPHLKFAHRSQAHFELRVRTFGHRHILQRQHRCPVVVGDLAQLLQRGLPSEQGGVVRTAQCQPELFAVLFVQPIVDRRHRDRLRSVPGIEGQCSARARVIVRLLRRVVRRRIRHPHLALAHRSQAHFELRVRTFGHRHVLQRQHRCPVVVGDLAQLLQRGLPSEQGGVVRTAQCQPELFAVLFVQPIVDRRHRDRLRSVPGIERQCSARARVIVRLLRRVVRRRIRHPHLALAHRSQAHFELRVRTFGHRHILQRQHRCPVVVGDLAQLLQRGLPSEQGGVVRTAQCQPELFAVLFVQPIVDRRHRDRLSTVSGLERQRPARARVIVRLLRRVVRRRIRHPHLALAHRSQAHFELRIRTFGHRHVLQRQHRCPVVVGDLAQLLQRGLPSEQGGVVRTAQRQLELLAVRLVQVVVFRRHRDRLSTVSGLEGQRPARARVVVLVRRVVRRCIRHRHLKFGRRSQAHLELRVRTLGHRHVLQRQHRRIVVVLDLAQLLQRGLPSEQGGVVRTAQRQLELLGVLFVQRVVRRRHRDRLSTVSGLERQRPGRARVVVLVRRVVRRRIRHRHLKLAVRVQAHLELHVRTFGHRHVLQRQHRRIVVVLDLTQLFEGSLVSVQGGVAGTAQRQLELFAVRLIQVVVFRRHRDRLSTVSGLEGQRPARARVVVLVRRVVRRRIRHRHLTLARRSQAHLELHVRTLGDRHVLQRQHRRIVVVRDRPRTRRAVRCQRRITGSAQPHLERLVRLVQRIVLGRHRDGLHPVARSERQRRARHRDVVPRLLRRAVRVTLRSLPSRWAGPGSPRTPPPGLLPPPWRFQSTPSAHRRRRRSSPSPSSRPPPIPHCRERSGLP